MGRSREIEWGSGIGRKKRWKEDEGSRWSVQESLKENATRTPAAPGGRGREGGKDVEERYERRRKRKGREEEGKRRQKLIVEMKREKKEMW